MAGPRRSQRTCSATQLQAVSLLVLFASTAKDSFCTGSAERGGEVVSGRCGESCSARESSQQWLGWMGVLAAVFFLGSNYVVVKRFDTGNGERIVGTHHSTHSNLSLSASLSVSLSVSCRPVLSVGTMCGDLDGGASS